jgi:hypothetical protein
LELFRNYYKLKSMVREVKDEKQEGGAEGQSA